MNWARFKKVSIVVLMVVTLTACGGRNRKNGPSPSETIQGSYGAMTVGLSDSLIRYRGADTLDFGRVREGETVLKELMIRNESEDPAVITRVDLTCGCVSADYPRQPLKPGEEAAMSVTFDSRGLGGWVYKTVLVYTTLSQKPYMLVVMAEIE